MSSNLTNLVSEESEVIELKTISIEDIRNRLIAIGINNTVSSYSAEDKQLSLVVSIYH